MRDFDERFEKRQKEFDRDWKQAKKWFWVGGAISFTFGLLVTGFSVWVIIMVMRYFGVI